MVRVSTVAVSRLVIVPVFCPTYAGVMKLNNIVYIRRATVTDFDRALIEHFM